MRNFLVPAGFNSINSAATQSKTEKEIKNEKTRHDNGNLFDNYRFSFC